MNNMGLQIEDDPDTTEDGNGKNVQGRSTLIRQNNIYYEGEMGGVGGLIPLSKHTKDYDTLSQE